MRTRWDHGCRTLLALTMLAVGYGCTNNLPAPALPEHLVPTVGGELPPPEPGMGLVIIEVVDGPARVDDVISRYEGSSTGVAVSTSGAVAVGSGNAEGESTRPVCQTPCQTHLSHGPHDLRFTPLGPTPEGQVASQVIVNVGAGTTVVRHVLARSRWRCGEGGIIAGALLCGLVGTLPIGIPIVVACPLDVTPAATSIWTLPPDPPAAEGPAEPPPRTRRRRRR